MRLRSLPLALSIALAVAACGDATPPPPSAAAPAATAPAKPDAAALAQQLEALYGEFWEEQLKLNPLQATFHGDTRYNYQLPNFMAK